MNEEPRPMAFDGRDHPREAPPVEQGGPNPNGTESGSIHPSVNDGGEERQRQRVFRLQPSHWAVWKQSTRMTAYEFAWEFIAIAAAVAMIATSPAPSRLDWFRLVLLGICATIHIQLSRRQEERRRSRQLTVHIELTAIWVFPAVLVLPVSLALLLILVVRVQRWFTARRPLHRYVFSTASLTCAALLTHVVLSG